MSELQEAMKYVVFGLSNKSACGGVMYAGSNLQEAERSARGAANQGGWAEVYALKETYELVVEKKMVIIKQGERSEKGAK